MRTSASVRTSSVFHRVGFFLQPASDLVALLSELGGKVKSLEQNLESERRALVSAPKALESERKARSEADREVLTLRGWVMGMEEASTRLREQVA